MAKIHNHTYFAMKRLGRTAYDFNMLGDGTRAIMALSGGSSSAALYVAMMYRLVHTPVKYKIVPVHVRVEADVRGRPDDVAASLQTLCARFGAVLRVETWNGCPDPGTDVPYQTALEAAAMELNCSRILLGHHLEDAVAHMWSTLVLSGRLTRLEPVALTNTEGVCVARPAISVTEDVLERLAAAEGIETWPRAAPRQDWECWSMLRDFLKTRPGGQVEKLKNLYQANDNVKGEYLV